MECSPKYGRSLLKHMYITALGGYCDLNISTVKVESFSLDRYYRKSMTLQCRPKYRYLLTGSWQELPAHVTIIK